MTLFEIMRHYQSMLKLRDSFSDKLQESHRDTANFWLMNIGISNDLQNNICESFDDRGRPAKSVKGD